MQEKICLKRTGNTGHFMESERNLYEYSNSFRHHTSGICTTGSEYLRYGLSHHWIKSAIPHRTLKNIQLTTSHRGRLIFPTTLSRLWLFQLTTSHRGRRQYSLWNCWNYKFQLTTSHRGRLERPCWISWTTTFQLTTSHRGRRSCPASSCTAQNISTHYLTQR